MRRVMVAACALALVVSGACGRGYGGGRGGGAPRPHDREVLIVLSVKGGRCGADAPNARAYRNDTVVFGIVNRCTAAEGDQTVELTFKGGDSLPPNPFTDQPPFKTSALQSGAKDQLKLRIKDEQSVVGSYTYDVLLNGRPGLDPGFEVDPW